MSRAIWYSTMDLAIQVTARIWRPTPLGKASESSTCAIIVTFNPEVAFFNPHKTVGPQVDHLIIVDNGSDPQTVRLLKKIGKSSNVSLVLNTENRGVATALNQGVQIAAELGYSWVLMLDQDSVPAGDMVRSLCEAEAYLNGCTQIAILAPRIRDLGTGETSKFLVPHWGIFFRRVECQGELIEGVTAVISSGALIRTSSVLECGGFREELFIDLVDTEFCLRLRRSGKKIVVVCRAILHHRLGDRKAVRIGPYSAHPYFHAPQRWYTISRNRIPLLFEYYKDFPHWFFYELISYTFNALRMLAFEDQKIDKLKAIVLGTIDGVRGNMGPPRTLSR